MCPTQLTDCPSRCAENSGDVTWDHPLDGPTRAKIAAARQAHAAKAAAQGPTAAGGISASVPDFAAAMTGGVAGQAAARSTGAATGAGAGANTGAGLSRMISHQEILSQPTPGASSLPSSDAEAKLASDLEAARQARTEAEKELAAATRAREAEARERQLLTNMVETMQSQLADARQEARELRASQTEMERARFGVRAPRRRTGVKGAKGTATTSRAAATAKWQGRFHSDKRGREETAAVVRREVHSRMRILEDGVEEVKGVEWALADLRRQRSEIRSLSGQGPKRRKRWAVVRDCDDDGCSDAEA